MRSRSLLATLVLVVGCLGLLAALEPQRKNEPEDKSTNHIEATPKRVLPGFLADGTVQLPNQWQLRPVGRQLEVGDLPVNIAMHPSGQYMAVLHSGMREHEIVIVELNRARQKIVSRVSVDESFYGLCFTPEGKKLFASGAEFEVIHEFDFERGLLGGGRIINLNGTVEKLIVGGLSTDPKGKDLFACATGGDAVFRISVDNPNNRVTIPVVRPEARNNKTDEPKGNPPSPPDGRKEEGAAKSKPPVQAHPYVVLVHPEGKKAYVSLWATTSVGIIDLEKNELVGYVPVAEHPTEMALSPDGKTLFVACANSTKVCVSETETDKPLQTINCAMYPSAPNGSTPNSLCLTPDGEMLFVANADNNNLAVFNVKDPKVAKPLGFIPVGWYPTSVRYNPTDKRLYVANGKGTTPKANRSGTNPNIGYSEIRAIPEYIGVLFKGCVTTIDMPTPERMAAYTKQAYLCSPLKDKNEVDTDGVPGDNPIPRKVGDPSPIKHVVYIIKENRTYDQVFGDMPQGNGEKELCLFPEAITPNHHKIAREFVLLDNIYVDGEVSADGHEWSMGAYATDFVEKMWPLSYRGIGRGKVGYPSEGTYDYAARPSGGYLWDKAAEAKATYRTYGEWIENGKRRPDGTYEDSRASVKSLEGHFDPKFVGYDLDYPDVKRADRFIEELREFEKKGEYPNLTILRLPNDHTSGTRTGKPTPTAQVADNDLALGMVVEALSESKFWKETAVFVIEDDAQNGPDHVDAHRVVALVISPYTKRAFVDSSLYSTTSMLRTMELILGLKPMSQFDAAARPMYHSFTTKPTLTPYKHEVPKTDLNARNVAGAFGAEWSERANLAKEDQADDQKLNEVIWKSVKGANARVPAPVRSAFFLPRVEIDDND